MSQERDNKPGTSSAVERSEASTGVPGKGTRVQRKAGGGATSDPAQVTAAAEHGVSGSGAEVPYRPQMEAGFGVDFGDVRAHTDAPAQGANQAMGAEAYTMGNTVAFGATPTPALVAHELAHVVQQRAGAGPDGGVGTAGDSFEREADDAASTVASGGTSDLAGRYGGGLLGGSIQRKAVQKYESGEHAIMGAGPGYPAGQGDLTMPNGAVVFTGELVAFGDFYADMQQMQTAPREEVESLAGICRLEAIWYRARLAASRNNATLGQVAPNAPGGAAPPGSTTGGNAAGTPTSGGSGAPSAANLRGGLPKITSADPIWTSDYEGHGSFASLRAAIYTQFKPTWDVFGIVLNEADAPETGMAIVRSTLGRRRFRGENNSLPRPGDPNAPNAAADPGHLGGDYLDLAQNNLSHFTADNWANWKDMHKAACETHAGAQTDQARRMALATDMLGSHFLTDRFSAGHFVDKAELMHYATGMMVEQAKSHHQPGANADALLTSSLTAAVKECFKDESVVAQWQAGCRAAVEQGVMNDREASLLANSTVVSNVVPGKLVGVIMEMPWRHYDGSAAPAVGGDARNYGPGQSEARGTADPGDKNAGAGDYHLGVGNLAALQVHDAINAIGFTVRNDQGSQWRVQGDDHLNADTLAISDQAVHASQDQVRAGNANPDALKPLMPRTAFMDPRWIDDFFQGEWQGVQFDQGRMRQLKATAASSTIKLQVDEKDPKSPEMANICHQIMEVLFLQPSGANATQSDAGTGLNVSMLKEFLRRRLHEMVPMAYMSTSAGDLPQGALELYAPKTADGGVLPRSANDFVWHGNQLVFNLNVTGCHAGEYTLGAKIYQRRAGYDMNAQGQMFGRGNPDASGGTVNGFAGAINGVMNAGARMDDTLQQTMPFQVSVPDHADAKAPLVVPVAINVPAHDADLDGERYVAVTGDSAGGCVIGRSNVADENDVAGNQSAHHAMPNATGADRTTGTKVMKVSGVKNGAMNWVSNTVVFSVEVDQTADVDTDVTFWVQEMDWDIIGSDANIGSPRAVTAHVQTGYNFSRIVSYTPTEDDWNDTYIKVYATPDCSGNPIAQSRTQGHDKGGPVPNQLGRKPANAATGLRWNGNVFAFNVTPLDSDPVYVRFFDKDFGYDYDEHGVLLSGPRNEDDPLGGIHEVSVQNGLGSVPGPDNSDAYGIVYKDAGCTAPLARGTTKG